MLFIFIYLTFFLKFFSYISFHSIHMSPEFFETCYHQTLYLTDTLKHLDYILIKNNRNFQKFFLLIFAAAITRY